MPKYHKITIISSESPDTGTINEQLLFLGGSLGLFNLRDKDKSCFRIFITLLKASKVDAPLSSDQLAEQLRLSRGTVVHHLNKLMSSGIVETGPQGYHMRMSSLKGTIASIQEDLQQTMDDLTRIAQHIDEQLPHYHHNEEE